MDNIQIHEEPMQTEPPVQSFDAFTSQMIVPNESGNTKPKSSKLKIFLFSFGIILFTGIIVGTSILISSKNPISPTAPQVKPQASDPTPTFAQPTLLPSPNITAFPTPALQTNVETSKVILTVGSEQIFQKDYDTELYYVPDPNEATKNVILEKLISDSKILQIAKNKNIIIDTVNINSLINDKVFNSPSKDYKKRIDLIAKIHKYFDQNDNIVSGYIVSLWFNNNWVGPLGYEESKKLAYKIISGLHDAVKNNIITIEEAGKELQSDDSLEILDKSYKNNALISFSVASDESITLESDFDSILKSLKVNEITDIYTGKSENTDNPSSFIDSYYMFGQIKSVNPKLNVQTFEALYNQLSPSYEVTKH